MTILVEAELKSGVSQREVLSWRKSWVVRGRERQLKEICKSAQRLVVAGSSPQRVLWLLETDDPAAVEIISNHFGEIWELESSLVLPQSVTQASRR